MWKHWTTSSLSFSPHSLITGTKFLHYTHRTTTPSGRRIYSFHFILSRSAMCGPTNCIAQEIQAHDNRRDRRLSDEEVSPKPIWKSLDITPPLEWFPGIRQSCKDLFILYSKSNKLFNGVVFLLLSRISFHMIWLWAFLGYFWKRKLVSFFGILLIMSYI